MGSSRGIAKTLILAMVLALAGKAQAQVTVTVASGTDLVNAITSVDTSTGINYIINFTASIKLGAANTLPAIATHSSVTINGQNFTLDGGGLQRGFTVSSGQVTIENLAIQNTLAEGGGGGSGGGGGGAGLGGALLVRDAVTLINDTFGSVNNPNRASGGTGGGSGTGGGGGGIGGFGGGGTAAAGGGGGGIGSGFTAFDANGGSALGGHGDSGIVLGASPAGSGYNGGAGGSGGGGGGAGGAGNSSGGGGGGIGTGTGAAGGNGGVGAFGGGGGGGGSGSSGGNGGFGGGGGGGGLGGSGGNGGFGGGGYFGGGFGSFGGGGGGSASGPGGGGAGAGGAIFVAPGGSLLIAGPLSIGSNSVSGGAPGGPGTGSGKALASGLFLAGNDQNNGGASGTLTFSPLAGQTVTISDAIGDQTGNGGTGVDGGTWGMTLNGPGQLQLSGANTFSGVVIVNTGTLAVNNPSGSATGTGSVYVGNGGSLVGTGTISGPMFVIAGGTLNGPLTLNSGATFEPGSTFSPGMAAAGTLQVASQASWFGGAVGNFFLGSGGGADVLALGAGSLTKQGSGVYLFNFGNTGAAGYTYTLASFGTTTFSPTDFTYTGLAAGLTGTFSLSGGLLTFAVTQIPPQAPVITSSLFVTGTVGSPFSYGIVAANLPTNYSSTIGLPPGLTLDSNSGIISGIPTQFGSFFVSISATNSTGNDTEVLNFSIAPAIPPPVPNSLATASGTVGSYFSYTISASNSPTSYSVTGSLPPGLSLNSSLGVIAGTPTQVGSVAFTIGATNSGGTGTERVTFNIGAPNPLLPAIAVQPAAQTIGTASSVVFSVTAGGSPSYQWQFNGQPISGATGARLVVTGATSANAGSYLCVVTNSTGSTTSNPATLAISSTTNVGRLINLSVNTTAGKSQVLTVGFVSGGSGTTGSENVLIRATGPALANLGVANTLADPTLTVLLGSTVVAANDNWGTPASNQAAVTAADAATFAFPLTDPASLDAALATPLSAGAYTAQISGNTAASGTALAEVYDNTALYAPASPRLINLSAKNQIAARGAITAGFVVGGATAKTILIRATGPALAGLGVPGTLPDPQIAVHATVNGQDAVLAANAGWGGDPQISAVDAAVGAFALTNPASADSVVLITLAPGSYTAVASSVSGVAGTVLVEVYEVP